MALGRKEQKDWYKVLGAKPSDSPAELKRKYQKLALLYHPDKQAAGAAAEERTRQFLEIHQAWKVLGNEETKQEYDLQQRGLGETQSMFKTLQGYKEKFLKSNQKKEYLEQNF